MPNEIVVRGSLSPPAQQCSRLKLDTSVAQNQGLHTSGNMGRKPQAARSREEKWQVAQEGIKSGNVLSKIPTLRSNSADGTPVSACFKTATIRSAVNPFCFTAEFPFFQVSNRPKSIFRPGLKIPGPGRTNRKDRRLVAKWPHAMRSRRKDGWVCFWLRRFRESVSRSDQFESPIVLQPVLFPAPPNFIAEEAGCP